MIFDIQDTHQQYTDHGSSYERESEQESGLRLDLLIENFESIAALVAYPESRERNRFVRTALRIGMPCHFSHHDTKRILAEDEPTMFHSDDFPVPLGQTVIISRRYFHTLFESTKSEQGTQLRALSLAQTKDILNRQHHPDGYNIGKNKVVPPMHLRLLPRYKDKQDLRGGSGNLR